MSDTPLLPCPFCGSAARMAQHNHLQAYPHKNPLWVFSVECDGAACVIKTSHLSTETEAAALWNRRDTTALDDLRAAVVAFLATLEAVLVEVRQGIPAPQTQAWNALDETETTMRRLVGMEAQRSIKSLE